MNEIDELLRLALGLGAESEEIGAARMALRAVVVYAVTVVVVRFGKKRFVGQTYRPSAAMSSAISSDRRGLLGGNLRETRPLLMGLPADPRRALDYPLGR